MKILGVIKNRAETKYDTYICIYVCKYCTKKIGRQKLSSLSVNLSKIPSRKVSPWKTLPEKKFSGKYCQEFSLPSPPAPLPGAKVYYIQGIPYLVKIIS